MQRLINRVYGLLVSALFWLFATPEANTPEANTPEVVEFYGFTVTDGWD